MSFLDSAALKQRTHNDSVRLLCQMARCEKKLAVVFMLTIVSRVMH
jgi:deoxyribose-phosphate aldolase